jgi:hypothetical protein
VITFHGSRTVGQMSLGRRSLMTNPSPNPHPSPNPNPNFHQRLSPKTFTKDFHQSGIRPTIPPPIPFNMDHHVQKTSIM